MAELTIALAPLLLLAAVALIATFVPLAYLGVGALGCIVVGFSFGVPSGVYYHVLLHRALTRVGPAPKGWYWHPQRHHGDLDDTAQLRLRAWFLVGAAGFGLSVLGFLLAVLTLVLWFRAGN